LQLYLIDSTPKGHSPQGAAVFGIEIHAVALRFDEAVERIEGIELRHCQADECYVPRLNRYKIIRLGSDGSMLGHAIQNNDSEVAGNPSPEIR